VKKAFSEAKSQRFVLFFQKREVDPNLHEVMCRGLCPRVEQNGGLRGQGPRGEQNGGLRGQSPRVEQKKLLEKRV
jgi:hypothetical protein